MKAISKGECMYDTGRTVGRSKAKVYESLHPESRKLMGLKPLTEIITNPDNLKIVKEYNSLFETKPSVEESLKGLLT